MSAPRLVSNVQRLMLALHLLLIVGLFKLVAGHATPTLLLLATAVVLPLLAALPGLVRGSAYTAGWASMLLCFYCALLLAEAYMLPSLKVEVVGLSVLAALDFVALMLFAKARKTADKLAAEA